MHSHGVGIFVEDPELKDLGNGKKVCHFRLNFVEVIKSGTETKKEYHWLPCVIWDTAAEYIVDNFKMGDKIEVIDATARRDMWKTDDGEKRSKIVFRINKFAKVN